LGAGVEGAGLDAGAAVADEDELEDSLDEPAEESDFDSVFVSDLAAVEPPSLPLLEPRLSLR
jgi:hypothetical protein